jgi:type I restriction enzyme S subunit
MEVATKDIEFERYSEYSETGTEWLGSLPSHWKVEKGKWLFKKEERPTREEDDIVTCFRDGQVTLRSNRRTDGFTNALKEHGYQGIREGDLVIHNMDAFAGAIGVSDSEGKSTPVYSVCTPQKMNHVDPYYYAYFLRNLAKTGFIESLAKGIRERSTDFRYNDFGKLLLAHPPKEEQTAIANFLDEKTAKIDEAISIKEKQIELLKERRQILIHKAVTRGLNLDVPLKPSGVDWIGDIPEHWEVKRMKYVTDLVSIKTTGAESELKYIGMENVESWTGNHVDTEGEAEGAANIFQKGDILFGKLRPYLAKVFLAENKGICSTEFLVYRSKNKVYNYYLKKFMISYGFISLINSSTYGAKMPRANSDFIGNQLMIIPPIEEQMKIYEFISSINEKIEKISVSKKQEIKKLEEYKTTLINSAVTGKIKVS